MQAQKTKATQVVNPTQSLAAVQTLLKAGIGCIMYLRNLLPMDHFDESYFTSTNDESLSFQSAGGEGPLRRNASSGGTFKIMTIMRGLSNEADKLLSHLENGIFDALEKQYLKSFILGIHLDGKDPTNVVETYTFKFQYHSIPGTNQAYPVMTLGLDALSLQDNPDISTEPIAKAIRSGRAPTVLDVKKSVKAMLKRLIQATTHMDSLPQRRYASFKIFYYDHTPDDYEPPTFQSGDVEKDRWYFTTHDKCEVPENSDLGDVRSGYHSVSINITSISSFLPNSACDNDAIFTGTTTHRQPHVAVLSNPVQEAKQREESAERQAKDAEERKFAWSADATETPPEEEPSTPGNSKLMLSKGVGLAEKVPFGVRNKDGIIVPWQESQIPVFEGVLRNVPKNVREIPMTDNLDGNTQVIESQGRQTSPSATGHQEGASSSSTLPPSDFTRSSSARDQSTAFDEMIIDTAHPAGQEDTEMIDMETQPLGAEINLGPSVETIESFATPVKSRSIEDIETITQQMKKSHTIDNGLQCECEIDADADALFCEGGCGYWYHVWCMGFHSTSDKRLPKAFKCFICRLKADMMWELIKETDMYPKMTASFKELALFRRAIKVAEKHSIDTLAIFAKVMGCDMVTARALFKRLEAEGFITSQSTEIDDFGLASRSQNTRGKTIKKAKPRRNLQRNRYIFVHTITKSSKYADYFNPDEEIEGMLLGIPEMKAQFIQARRLATAARNAPHQDSFTQMETQGTGRERDIDEAELERPNKKAKVSLTIAIDLAE